MTYDVGNPGPGLEQVHKYGRVKSVNGICGDKAYNIWFLVSITS